MTLPLWHINAVVGWGRSSHCLRQVGPTRLGVSDTGACTLCRSLTTWLKTTGRKIGIKSVRCVFLSQVAKK